MLAPQCQLDSNYSTSRFYIHLPSPTSQGGDLTWYWYLEGKQAICTDRLVLVQGHSFMHITGLPTQWSLSDKYVVCWHRTDQTWKTKPSHAPSTGEELLCWKAYPIFWVSVCVDSMRCWNGVEWIFTVGCHIDVIMSLSSPTASLYTSWHSTMIVTWPTPYIHLCTPLLMSCLWYSSWIMSLCTTWQEPHYQQECTIT